MDIDKVKKFITCNETMLILTEDGNTYGCGLNNYKQLHESGDKYIDKPVNINVHDKKIIDGFASSCKTFFLTEDGHLYAKGLNSYGSLGIGKDDCIVDKPSIVAIDGKVRDIIFCEVYTIFKTKNDFFVCGALDDLSDEFNHDFDKSNLLSDESDDLESHFCNTPRNIKTLSLFSNLVGKNIKDICVADEMVYILTDKNEIFEYSKNRHRKLYVPEEYENIKISKLLVQDDNVYFITNSNTHLFMLDPCSYSNDSSDNEEHESRTELEDTSLKLVFKNNLLSSQWKRELQDPILPFEVTNKKRKK